MSRIKTYRYGSRSHAIECVRAVLRVAFVALMLALCARQSHAQEHWLYVPDSVVDKAKPMQAYYTPDSALYDRWWHEIALCEHLELPPYYILVRWLEVNAAWFQLAEAPTHTGHLTLGQSFLLEWQVFVALPYIADEIVIKHEMVHWLLWWSKQLSGHPAPYFDGRCVPLDYPAKP